jgi:VCBS repeat-containing protein
VQAIEGYAEISYSLVQNGCPPMATCDHATNLYGVDPEFVDADAGNLRLVPDPAISPAIDVGQNAALPGAVLTDLDENPRFVDLAGGGAIVDLGAYEAQNIAPIAFDDSYLTLEDTALEIIDPAEGVLFNDEDANGDLLTAVLDEDPTHGDLLLDPDGTFTYTPDPGYTGDDSFSYHAYDGRVSSSPALVSITVREVNHAPVALPDSYETERNMPLHVLAADGVLFNDSDPDGDGLSAVLDLDTLHGALTLAADGNFTYLPEDGYVGMDHFAYHTYDGQLESGMVEVTIEVVNTPPLAMAESYQVDKNQVLTVSDPAEGLLANDEDGNGDALVVMLEHEPDNGVLSMNENGTFEYIPTVGFSGVDEFAYCASDGVDESNMVWIEIHVINHVPLAAVDSYEVTPNIPLRILDAAEGVLANDSDPDGDPLRVQFYTEPQGGLMMYPDGTFIYTPPPDFYGPDSFTYIVTDLDAISEPIEVTLTFSDDRARLWLPMTVH